MIRQHVVPKSLQGERYFRWRGGDVSRREAKTYYRRAQETAGDHDDIRNAAGYFLKDRYGM